MATIVLLADPPRPGVVLPDLPATSPFSAAEAADLYGAMLADVAAAADVSGGDLVVNYRDADTLPAPDDTETGGADSSDADAPEAAVRAAVAPALADPSEVRFEPQVGSTEAARVGNTVTHLLREEGADSVLVCWPEAPLLARTHVDGAAMRLRSNPVVLGPAGEGGVYAAGFTESIDFAGALAPPAVSTLVERAADADHAVDFLPTLPRVRDGRDLANLVAQLRARDGAGKALPERTLAAVEALGLAAVESPDGGLDIERS